MRGPGSGQPLGRRLLERDVEVNVQRLAESISRQSQELWSHLPATLVPDLDAPLGIGMDDEGSLVACTETEGFYLKHGLGWHWLRNSNPADVEPVGYRDGVEVCRGRVRKPPELN